ncbi:MAG TPA: VOC family protein [Chloroflexota bacterium]|nr:VOC family protein [Chloroflexota bacterium]
MGAIKGLGHVGIYVRDIGKMERFYRDFMGMTVTKRDAKGTAVFLSSDPEAVDHEIALMSGRPENERPKLIQQISLRVGSLQDVRDFYHRLKAEGYRIQRVVSHASAIGCYFYDPEDNVCEVFWLTGKTSWAVTAETVDLDQPDEAILAQVQEHWERTRVVPMGEAPPPELAYDPVGVAGR